MAKCRKCGCGNRILSNVVKNMSGCTKDVCSNPIYADPDMLSIYAPLIYDEIGINLCSTFSLGTGVISDYPTATGATVEIVNLTYEYGADTGVQIEIISGRQNCYLVTLSNLTALFAVHLFDECCRFLGTVYTTTVYLPEESGDTYDEDTNPSSVTLEIFAPYGISYTPGAEPTDNPTPALNFIGNTVGANSVTQGINMYLIPKVLNFNMEAATLTVGVTLVVQSLYFAGYRVASKGKINTTKGSIESVDDSACMQFVAGELLNLAIKPLDLSYPACESDLKQDLGGCCDECD